MHEVVENCVDIRDGAGAELATARVQRPREGGRVIALLERRLTLLRFLPSGAGALIVAEFFYKFHSFTAECLAFLATWLVFDLVREGLALAFRTSTDRGPDGLM